MDVRPTPGQFAYRQKGHIQCIHHGKEVKMHCEECEDLICDYCKTSGQHLGHVFSTLDDIIPERTEEIKDFIDVTERSTFPQIDHKIITANDILQQDTSHLGSLQKLVNKQRQKIKQDVDLLSDSIISSFQQLGKENGTLIRSYIKKLETKQKKFDQQIEECKTVLANGSAVDVYDVGKEIRGLMLALIPDIPTIEKASFSANRNHRDCLKQSIGTVSIPLSSSSTQGQSISEFRYNFSSPTSVIAEFECSNPIDAICPTSDGHTYTSYYNTVTLRNTRGEVQQKIGYKANITDISVSPDTQHLWKCSNVDCSVMEYEPSGMPIVRFITEDKPTCLCVAIDNCILIGMSKRVRKYTAEGEILLTTKTFQSGESVVFTPVSITECRVTRNVAIVDLQNKQDGGDGKPCVLVMDRNLQEILFCYNGDIPSRFQSTTKQRQQHFYPCGVRYDSEGNLVICDYNRGCFHLLSGGGDFLKLIHTGDKWVYCVGIDANDVLWIVTDNLSGKVKLIQYSNTAV